MGWVNREADGSGGWVWEDDLTGQQTDSPPTTQTSTAVIDPPPTGISGVPYRPGGTVNLNNAPPLQSGPAVQSSDFTTEGLMPSAPSVATPSNINMDEVGGKFMEWVGAGGSGDWDEFRKYVQATGGQDPGAYAPAKTGGVELAAPDGSAPQVSVSNRVQTLQQTVQAPPVQKAPIPSAPQITPSKPTPIVSTPRSTDSSTLALDESSSHTFYLKPDGTVVYVRPGQKVAGATPIQLTPGGARKLGWQGVKAGNSISGAVTQQVGQPTTPVSTPASQTTAPSSRTMYENSDGTVTSTPKDQNSTPVQVARTQSTMKATTPLGPTPGQLEVDKTPMTAVPMGIGQWVNDAPLTAAAKGLLAEQTNIDMNDPQAKQVIDQYSKQLASKMSGYGPEADMALNKIAQLAWYRQTGGQQGAPENAPKDYLESWKGAWRVGQLVPLGPSLDQTLIDNGLAPPNVHEAVNKAMQPRAGTDPAAIDNAGRAFANVQRLAQGDQNQYQNSDQWAQWYMASCGAASFAAMVNAANPDRKMTVGEAVNFLKSKNLISQSEGLLRGSDFTDISSALNQAIGTNRTQAVNMRTPEEVQKHFSSGGGAIMFTGPSGAVWGVPHIYVVTGASPDGVTIVDSSRANKTTLSWEQWRQQTALPGMGAGAAIMNTAENQTDDRIGWQARQAQGGAVLGGPSGGSARAKESQTGGSTWNPSVGGKSPGDNWTEADVLSFQDHLLKDAPLPDSLPPASSVGQDGFMRQWKPTLDRIQAETGLDAGTIMGLIVSESGYGDETSRVKSNNYFGMRVNQYDRFATGENSAGFAVYPNAKSSLARFIGVLSHPENTNYRQAWSNRSDPNGLIQGLVSGGYAPASENDQTNWRRIILDVANRYRGLQ